MTLKQYAEAIHDALDQEMGADERVFVLGEDVQQGVFRITEGLAAKYGARRVIDMPLAESSIVGVAIGAAFNGMRPVAEIQFADFIFPAMNQLVSEAARIRYRSNGGWGCPIVVRAPFGGGISGALYHSQSVEAFFMHVPGLKVVVPSTAADAAGLLRSAIRDEDPVLYFEHKRAYRLVKDEVPEGDYLVPIGPAEVRREGDDLTVFTYGFMVHEALQAAETLSAEGIEACVVDLRTLAPLDRETILDRARQTGKILIVHEDNITCGAGAEVAALIAQEAFESLDGPITRLAAPDVPAFPYNRGLEEHCLPNAEKIAAAMRELAAY
ncbi:MAG TPA: alpha-ketoacid dehydrogenase subunit beta [Dehalococcoidia bacterium]|nr:alpha-ketoacid dehydrogenase subunit beta [Dehalococcoidia bacterium]